MAFIKKNIMLEIVCILALSHSMACSNGQVQDTTRQKDTVMISTPIPKPVVDKFAWKPLVQDSTKLYIYLTFDDGPQAGTEICYDLLKEANVKASFFMVGLHSVKKRDGKTLVSRIRESYPQILLANHSYTHANDKYIYFYQHPLMAEQDFYKAQDSLHVPYKIIRLPGNSAWVTGGKLRATHLVKPVTELLDSAGYNVIGWDVEWHFNHKNARPVQSPEKLAAEVDSAFAQNHTHVKNQVVILSHDRMFQRPEDADSLAKFINILKQNPRYVFETVDHYPGVVLGH